MDRTKRYMTQSLRLISRPFFLACVALLLCGGRAPAAGLQASPVATGTNTVLHPAELEEVVPKTVFFRGQSAPVQLRNSGGVKFSDGFYFFSSLVDTSGYSTGIQAKYQAYFVSEVPLQLGDHPLPAGAYGVGFVADHRFIVMDLGAHDLFTVEYTRDDALRRPTPLQVTADEKSGGYRLYEGRNYISLTRAK